MSFLLWNNIPDDELMRAAAAGELTEDETLRVQLERMIAHPSFEDGVRAFFTDMWTLYQARRHDEGSHGLHAHEPGGGSFRARGDTAGCGRECGLRGRGLSRPVHHDADIPRPKACSIWQYGLRFARGFGEAFLDDGHRRGVLGRQLLGAAVPCGELQRDAARKVRPRGLALSVHSAAAV